MSDFEDIKVAVVCDWLTVYSGAEKVLSEIIGLFPESDLFSLVDFYDGDRSFLLGKRSQTSFIQNLPFAKKKYRSYLPFMPIAIEQFDLSEYDLIISSSHAVAKGVITGPDQIHICYIHSPIRYAWDLQGQYLRESGLESGFKGVLARIVLHYIRSFDVRSSNSVDFFISNSKFVSRRVSKFYRRKSDVIYPPVDVENFNLAIEKDEYYVTASRIVPYKRMDLIVDAFKSMPDKRLYVIGDGPGFRELVASAQGFDNIKILGYLSFDGLRSYLEKAKAFIFAAEEDFGIAPVEALACGTPVIAYGKGGARETVIENETGVFFYSQTAEAITESVRRFESLGGSIKPERCRAQAERFSPDIFRHRFRALVNKYVFDD